MKVLGLDTSTKTGAVVVDFFGHDGPITNGFKILFAEELEHKKLKDLERCAALAGDVIEIMETHTPDLAVIEGYGYGNANTLVTLVEIGTIIRYFLKQYQLPYVVVAPTTLKKFVTGKGNATKDQMMLQVYKRWRYEADTNNIADAVGLAMTGGALYGHLDMPKQNMEALKPLRRELPSLSLST